MTTTSGAALDTPRVRAGRPQGSRRVWLVFLALSAVTQLPYLEAALHPPPGRVFVGAFHWIDDVYNYVSFVQQAQEGRFVFTNKLVLTPHPPGLVNLEWWTVGRLSALLGGRPFLAYRLLGLVATLALLFAIDRWAASCGLPESHRLPALVLVCVGGGLGGWLFELTDLPASRCLDFVQALHPFIEILSNPHFVVGTALLAWGLWAQAASPPGGLSSSFTLGTALGLTRPYDLVTLAASRTLAVIPALGLRKAPRALLSSLLPLLPVCLYAAWVFYRHPGFAFYAGIPYSFPSLLDLVPAVGPPAALALLCLGSPARDDAARRFRVHLLAWVAFDLLVILLRPVHFAAQHLVGMTLPLLLLGALGLARWRPWATWLAAALLSFTSLVALKIVLSGDPAWFVPRERMDAALAIRPSCVDGDLMLGPPDVGLYAIGLTSCRAVLSHSVSPGFRERLESARGFYGAWDPERRRAWLDGLCVTHLMLPGDAGPAPVAWLGPATPFRRLRSLGTGASAVSVYVREDRSSCRRP